ncbi:hypothetical protein MKW98_030666 [Papaver atlanticum]|uniref:NOSIC domain-containing protein n=1 Tax=Papaver atlanticum TaxID=357466 RepID=A0AAD4RU41_9MAGN|nr:hypothetical protein MKW98_030666 [Papaver atlanticum]
MLSYFVHCYLKKKLLGGKVDTKISKPIGVVDDLDKELNKFALRVEDSYIHHYLELAYVVSDNILYVRVVNLVRNRTNAASLDFAEVLPEEIETHLKTAAVISMGPELN